LKDVLKPFKISFQNKNLKLNITDELEEELSHINLQDNDIKDPIKAKLCTDYKLYEEILFHIVSNACKFSKENETIEI